MSIEKDFDIPFIAHLALREKQIQQNYRPIIGIHKWFARRPGTLFRGLLLSEFSGEELRDSFYSSNHLKGVRIADPFMGGGTPIVEANRLGCDVIGYDINPMAYWIVRQEIEYLDVDEYRKSAKKLVDSLNSLVGHLYLTECLHCNSKKAHAKYFLWVKIQSCRNCKNEVDLFPGYLLAENERHPENVFVCSCCGDLNEVKDRRQPGSCRFCSLQLLLTGSAKRNHFTCPHCKKDNSYPSALSGPPRHRMFAIEYYCPQCKPQHRGRFFKRPDSNDLIKHNEAVSIWEKMRSRFVPDDEIPAGDETDRLHRWGYRYYREMFNPRQLLGLELSCQNIVKESDQRLRNALATNLSDLLRYQNMLCRYDTMALKSLDIFSVHGFPVGLVQCESNLLGIQNSSGSNIGSGGWSNIIEKYAKAKSYCNQPFEIRHSGKNKVQVPITGEWIGDHRDGDVSTEKRQVILHCQSATLSDLPADSLDAVFTDPPYFSNVQYAELIDFCYVWLRRLVGSDNPSFKMVSTRNKDELTGNITMDRGFDHFTEGLSAVFQRMAHALKPYAPLAFTYHHNDLEAYYPIAVAILDAGLTCSASLPCPAEMGGSIHISGTGSSVVDTVFVCRSKGSVLRRWIPDTPKGIAELVAEDVRQLREGGLKPTQGDIYCVIYGHLIRLTIWHLRRTWDKNEHVMERLRTVAIELNRFGKLDTVKKLLDDVLCDTPLKRYPSAQEAKEVYMMRNDEISF